MKAPLMTYLLKWLVLTCFVVGFGAFEAFNIQTTKKAFELIFGVNFLAILLAIAVATLDLGGLARVFTKATTFEEEPTWVWIIGGIWLLVAAMNCFLTWYVVSYNFQINPPKGPAVTQEHLNILALYISGMVFLVHVAMIYFVGAYIDATYRVQRRPMQSPQPQIATQTSFQQQQAYRTPVPTPPNRQQQPVPAQVKPLGVGSFLGRVAGNKTDSKK